MLVVPHPRDDLPNAATRVLRIAPPAGNDVEVAVEDRLPSHLSDVGSDIEAFDRRVRRTDQISGLSQ